MNELGEIVKVEVDAPAKIQKKIAYEQIKTLTSKRVSQKLMLSKENYITELNIKNSFFLMNQKTL